MTVEPFKYMLQPVAVERDDTGKVVREMTAQVLSVYSAEQAVEAIEQFEKAVAEQQAQQNGSGTASTG